MVGAEVFLGEIFGGRGRGALRGLRLRLGMKIKRGREAVGGALVCKCLVS